jgi:hypothetical protein
VVARLLLTKARVPATFHVVARLEATAARVTQVVARAAETDVRTDQVVDRLAMIA